MRNTSPHRLAVERRIAGAAFAVGLVVMLGLFGLVAAACSSGGGDAEAIATNQGAILVKPPDVLAGDPVPAGTPEQPAGAPVEGLSATPAVDFEWFDGTAGSTADFAGRPTVLNFWASNCPPCIAEMPEFEAANQALAGRVDFVGVNVADVRGSALELAELTGVTYPLADDPDSRIFRAFGGFVMPTTVFLNAQGQVAYVWAGVLTNDELRILIDEHILPGSNADA